MAAMAAGAPVQGIVLPPEQNAGREVVFLAGALQNSPHERAAAAYLRFLASPAGQDAYAAFGFIPATDAERTLQPISAK
jgi:ABC-type Fe3+ transport system substrate-binding protein